MDDAKQNNSHAYLSLRLVRIGNTVLAVPEADVLTVVDWREPSPIPFAPPTVLGVIAVQGKMFTVIDVAKLLGADTDQQKSILALRGGEQLALAVSAADKEIRIETNQINHPAEYPSLSKGTIERDGQLIHILAADKLFAMALQGHERRRRRF
jgi:chemotaxis signal transduction protein